MSNNRLTQSEYFKACSWLKENMHLPPMGRKALAKELKVSLGFEPSTDAAHRIAEEVGFQVIGIGKGTLRDKLEALERKLEETREELAMLAGTHAAALNALEERMSRMIEPTPEPVESPFQAG